MKWAKNFFDENKTFKLTPKLFIHLHSFEFDKKDKREHHNTGIKKKSLYYHSKPEKLIFLSITSWEKMAKRSAGRVLFLNLS